MTAQFFYIIAILTLVLTIALVIKAIIQLFKPQKILFFKYLLYAILFFIVCLGYVDVWYDKTH